MKNDNLILIAAALLGFMLYSKQASAQRAPVTQTSPKPAQTGANNNTQAQYWTSLLGPLVGAAVAKNAPINAAAVAGMTDAQAWDMADAGGWM